MEISEAELKQLEQQLKEAGNKLLNVPDSVDELWTVLDDVEKLLSKVDQSPKASMLDALKPSMKALIQDDLLKHSDVDVKVSVASCISEITRITAPDAPYDDDQMRDVFQLIVSSFEDLADQASRSYNKRASILETVSKVRSCVIMLDLECDALIVEMFEHFLRAVRDYHVEPSPIFSSMESIMVLVLDESEEIPAEMLKPLLSSVKKDSEGVLPIAQKLGEGVLLKSAEKLKPYLMPALTHLGDSLDTYTEIVTAVCEGTTAKFKPKDEIVSGPQPADEIKLAKGSEDETQQADESKLTTASSDHADQVDKEEPCPQDEVDVDPALDGSPKSVMSNGVNATGNEEASVDQESSKQPEEEENQQHPNTSKEDSDDSDTDEKLAKSKPEPTSNKRGKKSDTVVNSAEPSDSSHIEGEKEAEKLPSEDEKENEVKESSVEAAIPSETEKDTDVHVSSPKVIESKSATADVSSPSQSGSLREESFVKKAPRSKRKQVPEQDEIDTSNASSPSKSGTPPNESRSKKAGKSKNKVLAQQDTPSVDVKSPVVSSDSDVKPQKRTGKKEAVAKEVKLPAAVEEMEDDEASSDVKSPEVSSESDEEPPKRAGKKAVVAKEVKKLPATIDESEDDEAGSDSDEKPLSKSGKKLDPVNSRSKSKQPVKKGGAGDSEAKKPKQSGKESHAKKPKQTGKASKQSAKKEEDSDSDAKPLKMSVKKGEKRKLPVEEEEESDSDAKLIKLPAKKGNTNNSGDVKSSSKKKDDGRKRANAKNVIEKDEAKSSSSDDEMDTSPMSAAKSAKGEGNSKVTPGTSSKKKRTAVKDKVSGAIKYDESLVGKKVKVWWPEDKMYYEGEVTSFDSAKKKHKVSYVDGDEENLALKTQKWEIIQEYTPRDEEETEDQSEEASPEIHKKKKSKTDLTPSASQEKVKDSAKRSKASGSKDNKSKVNSNAKSTPKVAGKSKEDEETPKASTKTKQETSKTVNKSKGKTPQSGSKSNGPSKAKETEAAVKTPEKGGSKTSNKRKKRN